MNQIEPSSGEYIEHACMRLAAAAHDGPAFMIFNGTRVEAAPGDSPFTLRGRWWEARCTTAATPTTVAPSEYDDAPAKEVEELRALLAEARSYVLSLNAGRSELPGWAQLRVDLLVKKLNGSAPARLDADGTAKPLTEIVGVFPAGKRNLYANAESLVVRPTAEKGSTER